MNLPKPEDVRSIAVMGFGTMGHTWCTALLLGGLEVFVYEANKAVADANVPRVRGYFESMVAKGKFAGDVDEVMGRLHLVASMEALGETGVPIVLEVIFEDMQLKLDTYAKLGKIMPPDVLFWTNTSCLDVEKMGEASGRIEKFIGTHGMNPVHLMKGVEIVRHAKLDNDVLEFTNAMIRRIGKLPFATDNVPGFIVNNGLIMWIVHYVQMLERRQADIADIDTALQTSLGHPQGVFKLIDFIGINTSVLVAEELYSATMDPRYLVPPLLYKMRDAGWDGFKTGRGFYDWSDKKNPQAIPFEDLATRA